MASSLVISNVEQHRVLTLTTTWQLIANLLPERSGVLIANPPGAQDVVYRILAPGEDLPEGPADVTGATVANMPDGYIAGGETEIPPCKASARIAVASIAGTHKIKVAELP